MNDDLRSFVNFVRQETPREYLCIEKNVSPRWESAAIVTKLAERMRAPLIEFSSVAGSKLSIVTNVCASMARIARSQRVSTEQLEQRMVEAYARQIAPEFWQGPGHPPVREVIQSGDEVDLTQFPALFYTETQTHPYLTAACMVARDPESGVVNISFHRLMVLDRRRCGIFMTPNGDLDRIFQANSSDGRDTSVAVFIGAHPLWHLGSLAGGPGEIDELAVVGGLLGYPLQVTPSLVDESLPVPARAEIALEGKIRHDQSAIEGPFGEFAGYVAEPTNQPVLDVDYVTTRNEPLFQDIVAGGIEHLTMSGAALRAYMQFSLVQPNPSVVEVHLPAPMTLYVRIDPANDQQIDVRGLMTELLRREKYIKCVVCFNADVELRNTNSTQLAVATMVQAHRDVVVLENMPGNGVDPSESDGMTCKWGIDATGTQSSQHPIRNLIPKEVLDQIDLKNLFG